jgi:hypothetical protein
MRYDVTNYAPDADAINVAIRDNHNNLINVTVSRVEGGEVQISISRLGGSPIKRMTLGSQDYLIDPA